VRYGGDDIETLAQGVLRLIRRMFVALATIVFS
jgi:hypothetical protein